jgi:hypothetical protein
MGFQVSTVGNQSRAGIGVDADHLVRGPSKSVRKTREDGVVRFAREYRTEAGF